MPDVSLSGVVVTPADCYPEYAAEASRKFMDLLGTIEVPVAISRVRGIHAFPEMWRAQPHIINALPPLLNIDDPRTPLSSTEGVSFVINTLRRVSQPVTYLLTGPCTTLVAALRQEPSIAEKIGEIVWMAGAVQVVGNVRAYTHNGTAEWNVYWDAPAAHWLLQQHLPLTLVPLDVTNHVPVGIPFLKQLARQSQYEVSQLASVCWATTVNSIPGYDYLYHMWDVLATAYVGRRDLFTTRRAALHISLLPPDEGKTSEVPDGENRVSLVTQVQLAPFYEYLLVQFRRNFQYD